MILGKNKILLYLFVFVLSLIFILVIGFYYLPPYDEAGNENPSITFLKFLDHEEERSLNLISENCTRIDINHYVNPELEEGDNFIYERTIFGFISFGNDSMPLTLNDTYFIKGIKHYGITTCYIVISSFHDIGYSSDGSNISINIYNFTKNETICDNSSGVGIFHGLPPGGRYPFALYMMYLDEKFKAVCEYIYKFKYKESTFGRVIKNITKYISLNTTYEVIGEENIRGIDCYKIRIIKDYINNTIKGEPMISNDRYDIVYVDKKRRIVVKYESYIGTKLIERITLLNP